MIASCDRISDRHLTAHPFAFNNHSQALLYRGGTCGSRWSYGISVRESSFRSWAYHAVLLTGTLDDGIRQWNAVIINMRYMSPPRRGFT